jgi:hypothetical protein
MHRPRQADHGIGEIQIPGLGAEFFHVAGNGDHQRLIASGVGEGARATVFGVWLAHPVLEWNAPVFLPHFLSGTDLNRDDHKVSLRQGLAPLGGALDVHV